MNDKTPSGTLIGECAEDLSSYLRKGILGTDALTRGLSFDETHFADFETLKQTHFALSPSVTGYLQVLGTRVRSLKTTTKRVQTRTRGAIEGRIDWQATYEARYAEGGNRALFETRQAATEYNLPENLVVRKLIAVLEEVQREQLSKLDDEVLRKARWKPSGATVPLADELRRIVNWDVHIRRIKDPTDITLTDRDLTRAARARHSLYRDSAEQLRTYRWLMADEWDEPMVKELLERTLLYLDELPKLYELYCGYHLIRLLGSINDIEMQQLRSSEPLALFESDSQTITVYWDEHGPLSFNESVSAQPEYDISEPEYGFSDSYTQRFANAAEAYERAMASVTGSTQSMNFYRGQPDLIVVFTDGENNIERILIGEVKYRTSLKGFRAGLKQLIKYIHFARDEDYIVGDVDSLVWYLPMDMVRTRMVGGTILGQRNTSILQLTRSRTMLMGGTSWLPG